ncbi:hypothetical protein KS4_23230 [Poriferisphaera corsica]|uniref:Uncharacterized protein n=1 Tax=Poriferisphaera corsica TaxID=2528020 RepID=A0A517YVK3_9BACT|nr:hypothetical protein KS4_23230 [Poriferisphaera corsica]
MTCSKCRFCGEKCKGNENPKPTCKDCEARREANERAERNAVK